MLLQFYCNFLYMFGVYFNYLLFKVNWELNLKNYEKFMICVSKGKLVILWFKFNFQNFWDLLDNYDYLSIWENVTNYGDLRKMLALINFVILLQLWKNIDVGEIVIFGLFITLVDFGNYFYSMEIMDN